MATKVCQKFLYCDSTLTRKIQLWSSLLAFVCKNIHSEANSADNRPSENISIQMHLCALLRTLFVLTQESDFSWPEVLATLRDVSTQWLIVLLRTSGLRRYLRSSVVPLTSAYICRSRKYT